MGRIRSAAMNGTLKAIFGCVATLLLLAGLVTYLETRLPSETRDAVEADRQRCAADGLQLKALQEKIQGELKAHGDLLGETARAERWQELTQLAVEDLVGVEKRFKDEVDPLVAKNSREDDAAIHALLDEIDKKREEAVGSVSHLAARVKELAEILPRAAKAYEDLGKRIVADRASIARLTSAIGEFVKKTPAISPIVTREKWRPSLEICTRALGVVAGKHEGLQSLAKKRSATAAKEVLKASDALGGERARAVAKSSEVSQQFEALQTFVTKLPTYGRQVESDLQALTSLGFTKVALGAEELAKRYPFNATEIKRRTIAFASVESEAQRSGKRALAELKRPLGEINPAQVVRSVDLVHKRRSSAPAIVAAFQKQLVDLDRSYEKVLVDMEIKEGYEVTFHHEYMTVSAIRGQQGASVKRTWQVVASPVYKKLESSLGMTVSHKPYGFFTDQTERTHPTPAGMAYVGNPAYGKWDGERWVFNDDPQTKILVASAWGTHYPTHTKSDLQSFQQRRAPWVGRDRWGHAAYGSKGSLVLLIFAPSRYVRMKGFASTRYKTSGGTYRGTRYEQRRSTTVFVGGTRTSGSRYSSRSSTRTSYGK